MATGNGKIANLPREIREELNTRLYDGESGNDLVAWLNGKPEVMAVLNEHFEGRQVSEQNLSEWKKHGYQQWLTLHTILNESDSASESAETIAESGINCERLLLILTARYAALIQCWNLTPTDQLNYKMGVFRQLTDAVLACAGRNCNRSACRSRVNASNCSAKSSATNPRHLFHLPRPRPPTTLPPLVRPLPEGSTGARFRHPPMLLWLPSPKAANRRYRWSPLLRSTRPSRRTQHRQNRPSIKLHLPNRHPVLPATLTFSLSPREKILQQQLCRAFPGHRSRNHRLRRPRLWIDPASADSRLQKPAQPLQLTLIDLYLV